VGRGGGGARSSGHAVPRWLCPPPHTPDRRQGTCLCRGQHDHVTTDCRCERTHAPTHQQTHTHAHTCTCVQTHTHAYIYTYIYMEKPRVVCECTPHLHCCAATAAVGVDDVTGLCVCVCVCVWMGRRAATCWRRWCACGRRCCRASWRWRTPMPLRLAGPPCTSSKVSRCHSCHSGTTAVDLRTCARFLAVCLGLSSWPSS
jgi:hypothetical protein